MSFCKVYLQIFLDKTNYIDNLFVMMKLLGG